MQFFLLFQLVEKKGTATQFLDGSNRFYTLIPHDFGMKKPPMLDTAEIIKVILLSYFQFNRLLCTVECSVKALLYQYQKIGNTKLPTEFEG